MVDLKECEKVAVELAKAAGQMIKATCGKVSGSVATKQGSFADLVTETDQNVEKLVFSKLKEKYPNHKFIGEESVAANNHAKVSLTDEPTWIVDPVDGTTNFVHTFPYVAVCIGLAINKSPVMGVVYCPFLDKMYSASKGNGAYCNGNRIQVRPKQSLKESLVCFEFGSDRSKEKQDCNFQNIRSLIGKCHGLRSLGSAGMDICAVASGDLNGFFEHGLHCWDICAACAILVEAGGYMCDTSAQPLDLMKRKVIVACNEQIAKEIASALVADIELESD